MLIFLLALGPFLGCVEPADSGVGDTSTAQNEASISLLTPADGTTVCGSPFALEVSVENFILVGFEEEEVREGIGHVDIKLNGQNRWMTYYTEFEIPQVDDGLYLVEALLVHENHLPIEPYTAESVTVTVSASACSEG